MPSYSIWDKKRPLYPPVGPAWTPEEVFRQYGWAANSAAVVIISECGGTLQSLDNLEGLKEVHGITTTDVGQAVVAIEAAEKARRTAPPPPPPAVSGDVAAILEAIREEGRAEIRQRVAQVVDATTKQKLVASGVLPR